MEISSFISTTEERIKICFNDEQLSNAFFLIDAIDDVEMTCFSDLQLKNEPWQISISED